MSDCIIETRGLIKRYGDQVSVSMCRRGASTVS